MLYVLEEKSTNESGFAGVGTLAAVCNGTVTKKRYKLQTGRCVLRQIFPLRDFAPYLPKSAEAITRDVRC